MNKNFLKLYLGQSISQLTSSVLQMAIVWYLIAQGASSMIVALSGIMAFLPQGILGLFLGVYIDRYDRKKIMIWSDAIIAIASLSIVVVGIFGEIPTTLIMIVLAVRSIGTAFHQPSLGAVTPLIVDKEELSKYAGYSQGLQSISLILSPAIAAALFSVWPIEYIVFLDCFGALFAIMCIAFVKIPTNKDVEACDFNFISELKEGVNILKEGKLYGFMMAGALFSLAYMPIFVLYPMITLNYFGKSQWHAGLVEILFAVGMIIGATLLSKINIHSNKIKIVAVSTFIMAGCVLGSGLLPVGWFVLFVIFSMGLGFASPFYQGLQMTVFQERIDNKYLGRVMSLSGALMVIGTPIGIALSGFLSDMIGVNWCFVIFGIGMIVVSIVYFKLSLIYKKN